MPEITSRVLYQFDYVELVVNIGEGSNQRVAFRLSITGANGAVAVNITNSLQDIVDEVIAMTQQGLLHVT